MPWVRPLAAAVCAASHATISAWPRGNAATLALALRQSVCADSTPPLCASAWWVGATTPTSGSAAGTAWGVELADPSGAEPCAASANGAAARVAINRRDRVCAGRMGISKNKGLCSGSCRSATHHQHVTCKQRRSGCGGGQVLRARVRHNASHGSHRNTWATRCARAGCQAMPGSSVCAPASRLGVRTVAQWCSGDGRFVDRRGSGAVKVRVTAGEQRGGLTLGGGGAQVGGEQRRVADAAGRATGTMRVAAS